MYKGIELPRRQLVSQADQSMIEAPDVPRSVFIGSWTHKKTFDAGYLYPFLVDEIYPGDHMKYNVSAYVRMSTPLFPLLDEQRIDTHFFFVPYRLVWSNFVKFMGEQANPGDSIAYTIPQVLSTGFGFTVGGLGDHFGLPTVGQGTAQMSVNVLPFRAYRLIHNQWFRDENLINSLSVSMGDATDPEVNVGTVKLRAKSHDYFTSALPWAQKFTAPNIPLAGQAWVKGIGVNGAPAVGPLAVTESPGVAASPDYVEYYVAGATSVVVRSLITNEPQIYADLTSATGVSINQLRQAFMVQSLLERDARGGTRYTEIIKSHFRVTSPDARLQRTEYIGGGSTPMQLTPIAQTAPTTGVPLGALGAAGVAYGEHSASFAATEHGIVIGLVSVKTELSYSQGISRWWSRLTREEMYWPSLAGLGEQAILRKEIYATGNPANDDVVFGYQERYHELRTRVSEVTGLFRPTAAGNIDEWHLSQHFTAAPVLGQTFIEDTPPMSRVLAAGSLAAGQQYIGSFLIRREATRPVPQFGTPALLGRF